MSGAQGAGGTRSRSTTIAEGLAFTARWSLRLALIALGLALLWYLVASLWVIALPVLLALLISTVMYPPAAALHRRGVPTALAAAIVLLVIGLVLGVVVYFLTTSIAGGMSEIANSAVAGLQSIQDWLAGPPLNIGSTRLASYLQQITDQLQSSVSTIASRLLTGVGTVASAVTTLLLAVVLAFLFVKDGARFLPWLRRIVGPRVGGHLSVVLGQVWEVLGGYIRGQALVSLIDGVCIGIGLVVVGVPLALPLAVITVLGGFVPIVGALVAGVLSVLVALVSNGLTAALIVLAIVLFVQQVEGNVLQPVLQGRSLNLHAAVVLLAVAAGGSLYGIPGAFLAVPLTAAAATVLRYLLAQVDRSSEPDVLDAPADPDAAAAAEVPPAPDPTNVPAAVPLVAPASAPAGASEPDRGAPDPEREVVDDVTGAAEAPERGRARG